MACAAASASKKPIEPLPSAALKEADRMTLALGSRLKLSATRLVSVRLGLLTSPSYAEGLDDDSGLHVFWSSIFSIARRTPVTVAGRRQVGSFSTGEVGASTSA